MSTETTPATTTETKKMITLRTKDNEEFKIEETVALQSHTLKGMIEDDCADNIIPLPNVTGAIFAKVIEYCKKHATPNNEDSSAEEGDKAANKKTIDDLNEWDQDYINVDIYTLYDVMLAANYLHIKGLLDVACQKVADMIKGKTPEEIRHAFHIKNDFTPEEEEEIRKKNQWAFE